MRSAILLTSLAFAALFGVETLIPRAAWAVESTAAPFDDDDEKPPLLINRARPLKLSFEISLLFVPTIVEKYLNHTGGVLALTFHINDIFALEALGGYTYMREAAIIGGPFSVRTEQPGQDPSLPDLVGMSWLAQAGVSIAPIYGKLSFFSEVDINSQVYLVGGIGAVGAVKRQGLGNAADGELPPTELVPVGTKLAGNFGAGFKLFFTRWLGIRAEVRDIIFTDYFDFSGQGAAPEVDVIHNVVGLFGVTFIVN
jgi:outer membrane beta-barrel protein